MQLLIIALSHPSVLCNFVKIILICIQVLACCIFYGRIRYSVIAQIAQLSDVYAMCLFHFIALLLCAHLYGKEKNGTLFVPFGIHYQGSPLRPWPQKMTVFSGQRWHLDPPFTCADKDLKIRGHSTSSQSKNSFFSLIIKTFCHQHQCIVHEKTINLSAWMKEICTLLVKLYIICSRMQRVNLHARPSIIQVGCPTCCYQVCALDHDRGVLQTWFIIQSPVVVMMC